MLDPALPPDTERCLVACDERALHHIRPLASKIESLVFLSHFKEEPTDLSSHLIAGVKGVEFFVAQNNPDWGREVAKMLARSSERNVVVLAARASDIDTTEALAESMEMEANHFVVKHDKPKPSARPATPSKQARQPASNDVPLSRVTEDNIEQVSIDITKLPFTICGYRGDTVVIYSSRTMQLHHMSPSAFSKPSALIPLATHEQWQKALWGKSTKLKGDVLLVIQSAIWDAAIKRGVSTDEQIRGDGVWIDEGRIVVNYKDVFTIDNAKSEREAIDSNYLYITRGTSINTAKGMLQGDAFEIMSIVSKLAWTDEAFGEMLVGWIVSALVCGVLEWRSHAWILASAGSGKTWTTSKIVKPLLGNSAIVTSNTSTDAGIQQSIGNDARSVLWEEAEAEGKQEAEAMRRIMAMARLATDATTTRITGGRDGVAKRTRVTTQFLMSSTQRVNASDASDSRFVQLAMDKRNGNAQVFTTVIAPLEEKLMTPEFCKKFRGYVIRRAGEIRETAVRARKIVSESSKSSRQADLLSPLIAGYCAIAYDHATDDEITMVADRWMLAANLPTASDNSKQSVEQTLMSATIMYRQARVTIGTLIRYSATKHDEGKCLDELFGNNQYDNHRIAMVNNLLGTYGIFIKKIGNEDAKIFLLTNNNEFKTLFTKTEYGAIQLTSAFVQCGWVQDRMRTTGAIKGNHRGCSRLFSDFAEEEEPTPQPTTQPTDFYEETHGSPF